MPAGIRGQCYINLSIGGHAIAVNPSSLHYAYILSNIHQKVPSCVIEFIDTQNLYTNQFPIGDGMPLSLEFSRDADDGALIPDLSVFGTPRTIPGASYTSIRVDSFLNLTKYQRSLVSTPYEGTSSDVMSAVGGECGLSVTADTTQDTMKWLPSRKSYADFLREVCSRGWINDTSCMTMGVTEDKELRYRDLSQAFSKAPKARLTNGDINKMPGFIWMRDWQLATKSGVYNNAAAYGSRTAVVDLDGNVAKHEKVSGVRAAPHFEMSPEKREAAGVVRKNYQPFECGNVHPNYAKAAHQNKKLRSLYSFDINVVVPQYVGAQIFDVVELVIFTQPNSPEINRAYSGKYIVTAKCRYLASARYVEKYTLTTHGKQQQGNPQE